MRGLSRDFLLLFCKHPPPLEIFVFGWHHKLFKCKKRKATLVIVLKRAPKDLEAFYSWLPFRNERDYLNVYYSVLAFFIFSPNEI